MDDLFTRVSLSYSAHRGDEAFQFIDESMIDSADQLSLQDNERQLFCLVSIDVLERRCRSWMRLQRLLAKTDRFPVRQSIESYLQVVFEEMSTYSTRILHLIHHRLSISSETKIFYLKLQGDIHFLLSQTAQLDLKLDHFLSSLHFYNQSLDLPCPDIPELTSIIYNKALLFVIIMEEYDQARDLLRRAIDDFDRQQQPTDKLRSLLHHLESKL